LPPDRFPIDPYFTDLIESYFSAGDSVKAVELTRKLCDYNYERLDYFLRQDKYYITSAEYEIQSAIQNTSKAAGYCELNGKKELAEEINKKLEEYYGNYLGRQKALTK